MASQRNYLIVGIFLSFIFTTRLVLSFNTNSVSFIELLNWGSLVYMAFALFYLYPHFKDNDERTKLIRQKGMYFSIFIVISVLVVLLALIQFTTVNISTLNILRTLISITIIAIWTSWIILAKKL